MQFMKLTITPRAISGLMSSGILITLAMLTFSLVSCGGGGGGGTTSTAVSITSITPVGIVALNASAVARTITLNGTNFTNSMTLNIVDSSGTTAPYQVGATTFTSSNGTLSLSASLKIPSSTAPADKYVNVNVMSGGSKVATTVLGVAQNYKTLAIDIQPILNNLSSLNCSGCHDGTTTTLPGYQSTTTSANTLIRVPSTGCPNRLRAKPGDPRRSSSVLVDKILVASTGIAACSGTGMPFSTATPPLMLSNQNILDLEDWIAGGAF